VGRNHSATGGHAEESLKHRARDAGEKADLRFYQYRTAVSAEIAVPLRLRERPGPVGPLDPRRPAPPRIFPGAHRPKSLGRKIAPRDRGRISKSEGRAMNEILITTSNTILPAQSRCERALRTLRPVAKPAPNNARLRRERPSQRQAGACTWAQLPFGLIAGATGLIGGRQNQPAAGLTSILGMSVF